MIALDTVQTHRRVALTMRVELETEVDQVAGDCDHLGPGDISTKQETRVGSGQFHSVDR